jgi:hypothetical protein
MFLTNNRGKIMRVKNLVLAVTATAAMLVTAAPVQVHAEQFTDVTYHLLSLDIEGFNEVPVAGETAPYEQDYTVTAKYAEDDSPYSTKSYVSWLEYDPSGALTAGSEAIVYGPATTMNNGIKTFKDGYFYAAKPEVFFTYSFDYYKQYIAPKKINPYLETKDATVTVNGKTLNTHFDGYHESASIWVEANNDEPYAVTKCIANSDAMFRLYNPNSGEHFYTSGLAERTAVVAAGWNYEGIGWFAPKSGTPVLRMYNPVAGEHHYTTSSAEADALVAAGWNLESDCAWYSAPAETGAPLYREYNPNQYSCNHNYTTSQEENDMLVNAGWQYEGIAWYGLK